MPALPLLLNRHRIRPHRASIEPDFDAQTVLSEEPWNFVSMWLRRHGHKKATLYWDQAHHFFDSAARLPPISAPLPAYYAFLNATKCLLAVRRLQAADSHGVAGEAISGAVSLTKEAITLHTSGVLAALANYLRYPASKQTLNLKQALYNLPYIHRAFTLTFASVPELYVPLSEPEFVRKEGSSEAWVQGKFPKFYSSNAVLKKLPVGWERDAGREDVCMIRRKARFKWEDGASHEANIQRLTAYHVTTRRDIQYIVGSTRLWYLKQSPKTSLLVRQPPLVLSIAAMHRLSELARYSPDVFAKHFDSKHNWLISDFIRLAPMQVIDELSSEITGYELLRPGIDSRPR